MKISKETLERIAGLSKLEFNAPEMEAIEKDLEKILDFVNRLNEVPTDGVEPLIYLNPEVNILRDDEPKIEISHKEALMNAPSADSDFFKVPKVKE